MKQWSARLLLTVTLGLVTTLAVAWMLAVKIEADRGGWKYLLPRNLPPPYDEATSYTNFGSERRILRSADLQRSGLMHLPRTPEEANRWALDAERIAASAGTFPAWWGRSPDQADLPPDSLWAGSVQDARGWPVAALWCEWPIATGPGVTGRDSGALLGVRGGVEIDRGLGFEPAQQVRALPLRPVWAGLVANTAFYALVWWLAPRSIKMALKLRWRRPGVCPACSYDLTGNTTGVCPECGGTTHA